MTDNSFFTDLFYLDQDTVEFYDQKSVLKRLRVNLQRKFKDKKKNNLGYSSIDICKNNNLTIMNGIFGQDKNKGDMTFRNILSVNEKVPVNQVQLTHDNIWFIL